MSEGVEFTFLEGDDVCVGVGEGLEDGVEAFGPWVGR